MLFLSSRYFGSNKIQTGAYTKPSANSYLLFVKERSGVARLIIDEANNPEYFGVSNANLCAVLGIPLAHPIGNIGAEL
jgi:hypothetical protein